MGSGNFLLDGMESRNSGDGDGGECFICWKWFEFKYLTPHFLKIIDKREFETYNNSMVEEKRTPGEPGGTADTGGAPGQRKIQSPYDGIFQDYMNNKEVAGSFLREYVSEKITRHLDFDPRDITPEQLRESLTRAVNDGGAIMQTLGERFRQEGRQVGRQEGKQEGRDNMQFEVLRKSLSKGLPLDIVADLIGLPVKKVKQMKAQIEREQSSSGMPGPAQGSPA